jgi:alanyl-tRNA synthetase
MAMNMRGASQGSAAKIFVVLGVNEQNKASIVIALNKEAEKRFDAGKIVTCASSEIGGKGGGKGDMAQAGGVATSTKDLEKVLKSVEDYIKNAQTL